MIARAILPAAIAVCCLMAGCENSLLDRSLVFFTNTTIGVEVSVSPSDATAPVKLIIGYKRAEGVLNPVYHSQGVEAPVTTDESEALTGGSSYTDNEASKSGSSSYSKKWSKSVPIAGGPKTIQRYRAEAYSVIAKIAGEVQGKAGGSADGKLSVAQWFATGEAAKILARQPGIAGAVTGSSEVAKAAAQQTQFAALARADPVAGVFQTAVLSAVRRTLDEMARAGVARAVELRDNLDRLASIVPATYEFAPYERLDSNQLSVSNSFAQGDPVIGSGFLKLQDYLAVLHTSLEVLSDALEAVDAGDEFFLSIQAKDDQGNNVSLKVKLETVSVNGRVIVSRLREDLSKIRELLKAIQGQMANQPALREAALYVIGQGE